VAEAAAGEVVVADLADKFGLECLPFAAAFGAPATGAAGSFAGESGTATQPFDDGLEFPSLLRGEAGAEADVIELAMVVVEAKEQRADGFIFAGIAKTADHAIGGADALDLLHRGAFARGVRQVCALGDDAVEAGRGAFFHPALSLVVVGGRG